MKRVLALTILSLLFTSPASAQNNDAFDPAKRALVEELVAHYNPEMVRRWNRETTIRFIVFNSMNFTAMFDPFNDLRPTLDIYSQMLNESSAAQVAWVTCHELGHLLGHVPLHMSGYRDGFNMSAEGEADYFAGRCVLDFVRREDLRSRKIHPRCARHVSKRERQQCSYSIELTLEVIASTANGRKINPDAAEGIIPVDRVVNVPFGGVLIVNGIDYLHPAPDCRALSAIRGILGMPRPSCWYSPRN